MNDFMTVQETAIKWGVTERQVQLLCKANRIEGISRVGRNWIIPITAKKPTIDKRKSRGM